MARDACRSFRTARQARIDRCVRQVERDYKATIEAWPGFKAYQVIGSTVYVSSTSPELMVPRPYLMHIHLVGWEGTATRMDGNQFAAWRNSVAPLTTEQYGATYYETVLE